MGTSKLDSNLYTAPRHAVERRLQLRRELSAALLLLGQLLARLIRLRGARLAGAPQVG